MAEYKVGEAVTLIGRYSRYVYRGIIVEIDPYQRFIINLLKPIPTTGQPEVALVTQVITTITDPSLHHMTALEVLLYA